MHHFAILLALTAVFIGHVFAAEGGRKPQIVLLKLDDVVAARSGAAPVSARWQRVADYLKAEGIKGFLLIRLRDKGISGRQESRKSERPAR